MRSTLWTVVAFLAVASISAEKKIVCYFGSWSLYSEGKDKFHIDNINPNLCSHLMYAFVTVTVNADIYILDKYAALPAPEGSLDGFRRFNDLKKKNPHLKTLISLGGGSEGSTNFTVVASDANLRSKLVDNAANFVKKYGFDGLDFDWEYPNQRGGKEADKQNFVTLLKELRERFDREGLLLSAAVVAIEPMSKISYLISGVSKYLHFINLMTYDIHGSWDGKTGFNAPLYGRPQDQGMEKTLNVDAAVNYWISNGAPREKIILGIPLYGHTFTLSNVNQRGVGAPATEPGKPGPITHEAGSLGYNEICVMQKNQPGWEVRFDDEQQVPYMVKGDQWVGYDDPRSVAEKAAYINKEGLGGGMVWSVETDDFNGNCGETFPLLKTLNRGFGGK